MKTSKDMVSFRLEMFLQSDLEKSSQLPTLYPIILGAYLLERNVSRVQKRYRCQLHPAAWHVGYAVPDMRANLRMIRTAVQI